MLVKFPTSFTFFYGKYEDEFKLHNFLACSKSKNTIISNIKLFHFFLSMFWFKILNFDSFHCFFSVFWFIISDFDTFLCFLAPFWVKLDSFWLCFNRKSVIFLNYDNRVGESNKTFVLSHHRASRSAHGGSNSY